jgi:hypothetical protein
MSNKIFLEKNRNKFSNNMESAFNLALSTKTRVLSNENAVDNFSLYEQYNRERDNCSTYRLIVNINPICSNVLFNNKTEIVINEGSSACTLLIGDKTLSKDTYAPNALNTINNISHLDALRNTEYTHKDNGGFVYHCGLDIFNNHMLRKKEFIHINKYNITTTEKCGNVYNTIKDYLRDEDGNIIKENIHMTYDKSSTKTDMHLYQYDTIMSMSNAFLDNCIEKDGWWGFTNPNTIEIPNNSGDTININRMMANNKSCEFIDLYPDRSLFSFIPKYNKYRHRIEKNWDYCLTYPYKSDYNFIDTICGGEKQCIKANTKIRYNNYGIRVIECSSYFKHNLKQGNYINIYYYLPSYEVLKVNKDNVELSVIKENDIEYLCNKDSIDIYGNISNEAEDDTKYKKVISKDFSLYSMKIKVSSIGDINGDNKDRIFTIKYEDIECIYEHIKYFGFFFKKLSGNSECLYYARKFKKLKNIKGDDFHSEINKVAFGINIYGDNISQVIFSDDINLTGMVDNNQRPLSEIYFTIIKRNQGYKEWYNNNNFSGDTIEFSHCFGKVTSGIDFSGMEEEPFNYNIHYLHNIKIPEYPDNNSYFTTLSALGETILMGTPKTIEETINIENDEFYGDIVEYDIENAKETIISNVYHRFNTAQRETWNKDYKDIKQDVIVSDDYDSANGNKEVFKVDTYYVNNVRNPLDTNGKTPSELMFGNILPEGYYYNPHSKIQIQENDVQTSSSVAKFINYSNFKYERIQNYILIKENGEILFFENFEKAKENEKRGDEIVPQEGYYKLTFNTPINYGFYKGDYIAFYDIETMNIIWSEISEVSGSNLSVKIDESLLDGIIVSTELFTPKNAERRFYAFWSPDNVPLYAKLNRSTSKFVWRNIVKPSEVIRGSETYNRPFANGNFYIEKNINFFLRRQDPIGKYGLSGPLFKKISRAISNPLAKYVIKGYGPYDFSSIMSMFNNNDNCF